ncbi:MAG: hypothetical protein AAGD14_09325 [Planctomycetota bacterium]
MPGRAGLLAVFLAVIACRATTDYVYPDDLASPNYIRRTYAAREFNRRQDSDAAPAAFALLNDSHVTIRTLVSETLRSMSDGEDFGYDVDLQEADRVRVADRWQRWWEAGRE